MHLLILAFVFVAAPFAYADEAAKPPEAWEDGIRGNAQEIWDKLRKDDSKVIASEFIEWAYKNHRSKHDGDSQLSTAICLIQLEDDPLPHLRKMMTDKTPERRAYAALVAGMLGDTRLIVDLKQLLSDDKRLGQFEDDWHWNTVSAAAEAALRSMDTGGFAASFRAEGHPVSPWLPKQNKKAEQDAPSNGG